MNDRSNGMGCVMGCWLAALAAGILLAVMLMMFADFAFTPAAFFGLLAFVLGGAFLSWAICKGSSASASMGAGAAAGAGVAAAGAAASASTSSASATSANTGAATASSDAGGAAAGAGAATATAAPLASGDATVKSGTTLSGEEELAGRKGDWKYEGEAAKPAAKKPAAKKSAAKKPAAAKKAPAKAAAKPVAKDGKPELLKKARAGGPDDLKQIKGVGPKMEGMLHTMGVFHFDQVASWRKAEVQWVDDNLEGFKGRVSRDEWVKQAKILAKGGTTEFSKKVDKGGVY